MRLERSLTFGQVEADSIKRKGRRDAEAAKKIIECHLDRRERSPDRGDYAVRVTAKNQAAVSTQVCSLDAAKRNPGPLFKPQK